MDTEIDFDKWRKDPLRIEVVRMTKKIVYSFLIANKKAIKNLSIMYGPAILISLAAFQEAVPMKSYALMGGIAYVAYLFKNWYELNKPK